MSRAQSQVRGHVQCRQRCNRGGVGQASSSRIAATQIDDTAGLGWQQGRQAAAVLAFDR